MKTKTNDQRRNFEQTKREKIYFVELKSNSPLKSNKSYNLLKGVFPQKIAAIGCSLLDS